LRRGGACGAIVGWGGAIALLFINLFANAIASSVNSNAIALTTPEHSIALALVDALVGRTGLPLRKHI
jgi:hypothetical protein